uniref:Thylakoid formation protein n=1 Tax=Siphoviridae sp. ctwfx1 TaxID=2825732 RepID=A0A8S5UVJ1_9CAUD|nr:MAG TPA: Thylakoid formation protein [Siphoviridae sp. ctwfx1]
MQAKALCGLLGTTPEALRSDANKILGGAQNASQAPQKGKTGQSTKFPRLKQP